MSPRDVASVIGSRALNPDTGSAPAGGSGSGVESVPALNFGGEMGIARGGKYPSMTAHYER